MRLRRATMEDVELLLQWRNDPQTRAMSFTEEAVLPDAHAAWLQKVLADDRLTVFVAEAEDGPVGTVRLDFRNDPAVISVTVAPAQRGRGRAAPMIEAASRPSTSIIEAHVKPENVASVRAFLAAGYELREELGNRIVLVWRPSGPGA